MCKDNCFLKISESTTDCSNLKISNDYKTDSWVVNSVIKNFKMANRDDLYNNVTHQLIQKLKNSVQEKNVNELGNLYHKVKATLNDKLWLTVLILSVVLSFGILISGFVIYVKCYKKRQPVFVASNSGIRFYKA